MGDPPAPIAWLSELLDVLEERRTTLLATTGLVVVLCLIASAIFPSLLPPRAGVGIAVAIAALLLGIAVAMAGDASDLVVRGPRHVRACGAEIAVLVHGPDDHHALDLLVTDLAAAASNVTQRIAIAPAGSLPGPATTWADALGRRIARQGRRVLTCDLTSNVPDDRPGAIEVARGEARMVDVVEFDPELILARIGAGGDPAAARATLSAFGDRLPGDIEVLLVALPGLARPGTVEAAAAVHRVLLLVEEGRTSRVDLIAALDALEGAGRQIEVVFVSSPSHAPAPAPQSARPAAAAAAPAAAAPALAPLEEPSFDPAPAAAVASTATPAVEVLADTNSVSPFSALTAELALDAVAPEPTFSDLEDLGGDAGDHRGDLGASGQSEEFEEQYLEEQDLEDPDRSLDEVIGTSSTPVPEGIGAREGEPMPATQTDRFAAPMPDEPAADTVAPLDATGRMDAVRVPAAGLRDDVAAAPSPWSPGGPVSRDPAQPAAAATDAVPSEPLALAAALDALAREIWSRDEERARS